MAWTDYYHHYDVQGSTDCLTDDTQTKVVERFVDTAYGERLDIVGDPTLTPFQWNGSSGCAGPANVCWYGRGAGKDCFRWFFDRVVRREPL